MAIIKEELPVLEIKGNGYYIRQVAVTCRRSTSVVRNLQFLTPFFNLELIRITTSYYLRTVAT